MNYLIVSDSHGIENDMLDLFDSYQGYTIIHCGDFCINSSILDKYNVLYVKGNCDFFGDNERIINSDYGLMYVCHGHQYNVKYQYESIYYRGKELNAKYVIFGHTHVAMCEKIENMWLINPGSLKDGTYVLIEDGIPMIRRR